MEFEEGKSCSDPRITRALIDENYAADRDPEPCPEQTRQETRGSSEALGNSVFLRLRVLEIKLTSLPLGTSAAGQQLVLAAQTEFTIAAQPTRCGRTRRTRDMVEVTACICGITVERESRNSNAAVKCGYKGCETLWVSKFRPLPTIALSKILSFTSNVLILR